MFVVVAKFVYSQCELVLLRAQIHKFAGWYEGGWGVCINFMLTWVGGRGELLNIH